MAALLIRRFTKSIKAADDEKSLDFSSDAEEFNDEVDNLDYLCDSCILEEYPDLCKLRTRYKYWLSVREHPLTAKDNRYYVVVTPYGKRKGMTFEDFELMIVKRWHPKAYLIIREDRKEDGTMINPHFNVLITTKKVLKNSNNNSLNIVVQDCFTQKDIFQVIDYCFKTFEVPIYRKIKYRKDIAGSYDINRCRQKRGKVEVEKSVDEEKSE